MIFLVKRSALIKAGVLALIIVSVVVILFIIMRDETVSTSGEGNWGLSFQQSGEPPVAVSYTHLTLPTKA